MNHGGVSGYLKMGGQVVMWRAAWRRSLFCQKLGGQLPTSHLRPWIIIHFCLNHFKILVDIREMLLPDQDFYFWMIMWKLCPKILYVFIFSEGKKQEDARCPSPRLSILNFYIFICVKVIHPSTINAWKKLLCTTKKLLSAAGPA